MSYENYYGAAECWMKDLLEHCHLQVGKTKNTSFVSYIIIVVV